MKRQNHILLLVALTFFTYTIVASAEWDRGQPSPIPSPTNGTCIRQGWGQPPICNGVPLPSPNVPTVPSNPAAEIVAQHVTEVEFGPIEIRGIYRFQILDSGEIWVIDNKNKRTLLAKVLVSGIQNLQAEIDGLGTVSLRRRSGQGCSEAPSQSISVRQRNGKFLEIWSLKDCLESTSRDPNISKIAEVVKTFEQAFSSLKY